MRHVADCACSGGKASAVIDGRKVEWLTGQADFRCVAADIVPETPKLGVVVVLTPVEAARLAARLELVEGRDYVIRRAIPKTL